MPMNPDKLPVVLVLSGNDPTGGAGLQADIETLVSLGCHPAPVVTALTVQDTVGVKHYAPVEANMVIAQARAVLEDMPVAAIKAGMLGSADNVTALAGIMHDYPEIPLILDPVFASGRGDPLSDDALVEAMSALLIPNTALITPNIMELMRLAPDADNVDAAAQELLSMGCAFVLVTGTHDKTPEVINRLYGNRRLLETFKWERLPYSYHGSGCTLAAACAATFAHDMDVIEAVAEAQDFTWHALERGARLGMGQLLPDRLYWARDQEDFDTDDDEDEGEESIH
jgi:hydroxymethylpyrimidine/phosphomethylpyrimidine kinase